jgi:hypothetical protein
MTDVPVPECQKACVGKRTSFNAEYEVLITKHPDAAAQLKQLFKILCDIKDVADYTPASAGEGADWTSIVKKAEKNRASYYNALTGNAVYSALHCTYTVTLNELK